jgi:site-specific recombinase XerC
LDHVDWDNGTLLVRGKGDRQERLPLPQDVGKALAALHCRGKGRKERCTPLRKDTVAALRIWLHERQGEPTDPLFPNARGGSLIARQLGIVRASVYRTLAGRDRT